ncbi:SDR family NAD(P)-dependent oxidoreductase [Furfurilactobacillus siliginis]|uniref:Oxidoreductase n=1 Tax=Furfurilactobacillus siliginis TaxID=348151 RepID=A0A0R2L6B3_9LACO|nr:SDR family oxidoreductase [Furfurilactobacillus siliginis]KRN97352.1 short chain dehydrogenase [Furfurilactobacillus siliginis]GEK28974.1 oxidoreductase [Furfurilactobacillus siliginis]
MELNLTDKVALITGSTKGIGKAIAIEMAKEGATVIINGRSQASVSQAMTDIVATVPTAKLKAAPFDLTTADGRTALETAFPTLDILINNMGIFEAMDYFDIDDDTWERYFRTNVLSGNALAKFYLPGLLKQNFGRIIFIASEAAIQPSPEMPQYSMTKAMELNLAKSMANLTKATGVTVNTVMPGSTLTEGVVDFINDLYPDPNMDFASKEREYMAKNRPTSTLGRLIRPEEIGKLVAFVASPAVGAFSGNAIRMDGGIVPTMF